MNALGVAAIAVLLFAIPLAVVAANLIRADAIAELEHVATAAERSVGADSLLSQDPTEFSARAGEDRIALYDAKGGLRAGDGPKRLDDGLRTVLSGRVARVRGSSDAVAIPIIQNEAVLGAIRAQSSSGQTQSRIVRAWALIASLAMAAILIAGFLASRRARRLAEPLVALEAAALRIGDGDFANSTPRSGVAEIDAVANALDVTASRLGQALQRERSFSADASHQLRTPIAALQVTLEAAKLAGRLDMAVIDTALIETERLTTTVNDLLALARDAHGARDVLDLGALFDEIESEWHGTLARDGRSLSVQVASELPSVRASGSAIHHVVGVMVANATEHGAGVVRIVVRRVGDGVVIDVSDEGAGFANLVGTMFERRSGDDPRRGIGLALARSLAEAEGGRLFVTHAGTGPTLSVLLPHNR